MDIHSRYSGNEYILVPSPPIHTNGGRGFSLANGWENLESTDFVEKIIIWLASELTLDLFLETN